MTDLQQTFDYTVTAGTPVTAPLVEDAIPRGPYNLARVTIVIPPGHCGLTGIQLWYGGNAAIPYASGWISGDNEVYTVEVSATYPPGAAWQAAMLNNDVYDHHFQVRWEMNLMSKRAASRFLRVGLGDIYLAAEGG